MSSLNLIITMLVIFQLVTPSGSKMSADFLTFCSDRTWQSRGSHHCIETGQLHKDIKINR